MTTKPLDKSREQFIEELLASNFTTYFAATHPKYSTGNKAFRFTTTPVSAAVPYSWRYAEARAKLFELGELLTVEEAERRNINFVNPALKNFMPAASLTTLRGGIQLLLPGERAYTHRHSANAFRFILEAPDHGAYTVVEGTKIPMHPGDLVLTPNWTWHDHQSGAFMQSRMFGPSMLGWRLTAAVLGALIAGGATIWAQRSAPVPENVLEGVIDLHHHSEPDERERNLDTIDAALYARLKGMRGAVFKSHSQQTATTTWLAAKMVPGFLAIPVIDLNLVHGGLNPYAVDNFAIIIKKPNNPAADTGVVMLPSDTSCYQKQVDKSGGDCVAISKDGRLLPETFAIITLVKKHGLVLASGHASPEECVLLAREAQRQGVPFTVTHVNLNTTPPMLDLPHMQDVARAGGYLEFASQSQRPSPTLEQRNMRSAELIRQIGPQHVILETDLGQVNNEPAPDGLASFIMNLRAKGFTKAETDMMSKVNPAKLLGLPLPGAAQASPQ